MHRLLADTETLKCDLPILSREAANHLKVLRPKNGEEVELFDGSGLKRVYRYNASLRELEAAGDLTRHAKASSSSVTLFACVTKGSRWDWTLDKATELGVDRIVPVISARTIVRVDAAERPVKRERWMRIVEEAARQSDAVFVPEIADIVDFKESLELVKKTNCFIGALMTPPPKHLLEEVMSAKAKSQNADYSVYIGPEGDFTPEELSALLEIARPVSFGSQILRAETAAIFALSVIRAAISYS